MTHIERIDAWIGKTLYHPIIVAIAQKTKLGQYALFRLGWLIYIVSCVVEGLIRGRIIWSVILSIIAILMLLNYLVKGNQHVDGKRRQDMRLIILGVIIFSSLILMAFVMQGALSPQVFLVGRAQDAFLLGAEYAATITTIPPPSTRRAKEKMKASQA